MSLQYIYIESEGSVKTVEIEQNQRLENEALDATCPDWRD